jgi:beta-lactamase superfamily II metal-dependent hydrolase
VTCTISFLPVGNADSIVIQTDNSMIVVDLGDLSVLEEWIEQHQIAKIDRIYITHAHGDHFPSLIKLTTFIDDYQSKIKIEKIHLPYKVIELAEQKLLLSPNAPKNRELRLSLKCIKEWSINREVKHSPIVLDGEVYSDKTLKIEPLHPSQGYIESHLVSSKNKLNEISVVLRLIYGKFSGILLADIEGDGLNELLKLKTEFTANVVKIPHHGAWPKNGEDLKTLLEFIDPEIAVLSVGSQNSYGHVKPELFDALINLKNDSSKRLNKFICTEVTRTCKYSASNCLKMDRKGLSSTEKCAGEITIIAEESGKWTYKTETNHSNVVRDFNYAACTEDADLS